MLTSVPIRRTPCRVRPSKVDGAGAIRLLRVTTRTEHRQSTLLAPSSRIHASPNPEETNTTGADADAAEEARMEARMEALESRLRSTGSSPSQSAGRASSATRNEQKPVGQRATWKKGELFPEGWEEMDPIEKATELYLGERGILFWSTQLTIGGLVLLVVAWVGFRFIGPSLGLYALENDPNL